MVQHLPAAGHPRPVEKGLLQLRLQPWQRNLAIIIATEFGAMMAFSFVDPLLPLYIQKLGGFTTKQAAFWVGMAGQRSRRGDVHRLARLGSRGRPLRAAS